MLVLAWANLTHRKVRTALSVLAVAIAITLLLVLVGLANGTLNEISQRMQSVEAEIVLRDRHFDLGTMSGGKLWEKEIPQLQSITIDSTQAIERVIPVFLGRMKLAGLSQNVFGICPDDFPIFAGSRQIVKGTLFNDAKTPRDALENFDRKAGSAGSDFAAVLPLIIDKRLAGAANIKVGEAANYGDTPAKIVGIVETGVAGRVFAPINMLRGANGVAARTAHMFFLKANSTLDTAELHQLCQKIEQTTPRKATLVANYGQVLAENFKNLTIFMGIVSTIAMVICFLFILVTMYTIVLERGKEIAIMQSLGAGSVTILRQTIQEALLICCFGTALGIALTYASRWLIQTSQPLITMEIKAIWIVIAGVVGIVGGILSALYPGWIALRRDPIEALSFE